MTVPCPKCNAKAPLDLPHIPEDGTSAKCPECNTRFWITRESFARRALKKEGKALCYYCNNELNNYLDCPTCGVMYPDFCVVQTSKPVKKKKRTTSSAISFSIRPQRRTRGVALQQATHKPSKSISIIYVVVALVAVLAITLGISYHKKQSEQQYVSGFIRTLYGIKLGTDLNIKQCSTIAANWKAKMDTGQKFDLRISDEDKSKLDSAKSDIDVLMQKLAKVPGKYSKANENLAKLYGIYTKSYSLAAAPSGTLPVFTDSAGKLESEFKQTAQELKASLSAGLADKYQTALPKFKELQNL